MDAAIYRRLSQDRLGTELGVDRQGEDGHQLARSRGWRVVAEHTDNDLSASGKRRRPGFEALLADIESGRVQAVIAWDLSRLTRNSRDTLRLLDLGETRHLTLALVQGSDMNLGTSEGLLAASILASVARHEIKVKGDRQQREVIQRAQQGKPHGGPRAHGFEPDGRTLRPAEAEQIARWYKEFNVGRSLASIARESGMNQSTVRRILLNPRYCALRILNGREYPAQWPAIVPVEVWRAVSARLTDPGRRTNTQGTARKWIGTGLYVCGRCDDEKAVTAWDRNKKRVYRCRGCSRTWRADPIDAFITVAVTGRLRQPELATLLPRNRPDLDALRAERKALRSRLESLASSWALGTLTDDQLAVANSTVRERLEAVEAALQEAGRTDAVEELLDHDDPGAAWLAIPEDQVERRQRVVRRLADVVLGDSPLGRTQWTPAVVLGPSRWVGDSKTWAQLYIDGRDTHEGGSLRSNL